MQRFTLNDFTSCCFGENLVQNSCTKKFCKNIQNIKSMLLCSAQGCDELKAQGKVQITIEQKLQYFNVLSTLQISVSQREKQRQ